MAKKMSKKTTKSKGITLVVSDDKKPAIQIEPGMKLEVVSVSLVAPSQKSAALVAARLCGGTNTCVALIKTGD